MEESNVFSRELAKRLLPFLFQDEPSIDEGTNIAETNEYE